jgi:CDGSH-type Zn-finger protein
MQLFALKPLASFRVFRGLAKRQEPLSFEIRYELSSALPPKSIVDHQGLAPPYSESSVQKRWGETPSSHASHDGARLRRAEAPTPVFTRHRYLRRVNTMSEPIICQRKPFVQKVEPGTYWWCACGRSKTQPFCDGSHEGTGLEPKEVEITEATNKAWCGCKHSKDGAFCDGTHKELA